MRCSRKKTYFNLLSYLKKIYFHRPSKSVAIFFSAKEGAKKPATSSSSNKIKLTKPAVSTSSKSKVTDKGQAKATKSSVKESDKKASNKKPEKSKLTEKKSSAGQKSKESERKGTSQGRFYVLLYWLSVLT
jgi:cobalamin biosynthesis Mg chelatase CobN